MTEAETRPARRRTGPGGPRTVAKGRAPAPARAVHARPGARRVSQFNLMGFKAAA